MRISFDKALGIHQDALKIHAKRAQLLANNLANADTPGFKAKDIDFKEALAMSKGGDNPSKLTTTNSKHIGFDKDLSLSTHYRVPLQPSVDGNTVDERVEVSKFTENSMRYMASLRFLDGKFKGLMRAIKGE